MKKIMYILIGVLLASLVYITFLSDMPTVNIPDAIASENPYNEENPDVVNEDEYYEEPVEGYEEEKLKGYKVDRSIVESNLINVGKTDPMHYKRELKPVENANSGGLVGNLNIPSNPVNTSKPIEPSEFINPIDPVEPIETKEPNIVVETDNEEIKEVIGSLDKEEVKKTFKAIDIHDFMKSFNEEKNKRDEIEQIVELSYTCEKCGELFLLPLDTKNISIPKVYGAKEDVKYPIYTGMDIVLKENEGFIVYSKAEGKVKSIEIGKEDECSIVIIEQNDGDMIYEHLNHINEELEVGKEVEEGQIIGEVKAIGSPKGLNYNIKVDMGGYRVNSNVFIVTEEQEDEINK